MLKSLAFLLVCTITFTSYSQKSTVSGTITDQGTPVPFGVVSIKGMKISTTADSIGQFELVNVPYGRQTIVVSSSEYETTESVIHVNKPETIIPAIQMKSNLIEEVVIMKTKAEIVKEQPFAVESIDMKPLQNRNLNVNQVLNQTTGVRIRETGGLGSDFVFSLSGFTGNQVRFFVDGLPTEVLGSAYSINSVPVNNVERVEIYKGVVPVHLGSDVLGGAVNIVTNNSLKNYLDVSYGFGSFNTHQTSVVGRKGFKNGFIINASAFYNYSDNNFKIQTYLFDKKTGKKDDFITEVERFNDAYKSATGNIEFGIVKKKFADRLMIGLIASTQYKEIQNGANMNIVAGEVHTTERSFIPTIKYEKNNLFIKNLSLRVSGLYSNVTQQNVDTSSRVYDWTGAYTYKTLSNYSGELNWYTTMFTFNDQSAFGLATLNYTIGSNQQITLNNTYSRIQRTGSDPLKQGPLPFTDPNILAKNFTGLSYQIKLFDNRFTGNAFVKSFHLNSLLYQEVYVEETDENVIRKETKQLQLPGFGAAASYFVFSSLQLKASYENTYRLPEGYEVFGDGLLQQPNALLEPEKSQNYNVGFLFGKKFNKHIVNFEFNYLYRQPTNLIRNVAIGITSQYQNLGHANIHCFEGAVTYKFKSYLTVELNSTLQNIRNEALKPNGEPDLLNGDRLPNTPFLFGNANISFNSKQFGKTKQTYGVSWSTSYIEEFFLKWESQGSLDSKFVIPRQLVSNLALTYSAFNGRYNVSLACMNIFDALCYDNFKIQKPGRSFNIKLRYYIAK